MTIADPLLEKLAEWRPDSDQNTLDVAHPETGWSVSLNASHVEKLGSEVNELTLKGPALAVEQLHEYAEQLVQRTAGLEVLKLLEVDRGTGVALIRSETPTETAGRLFYSELLAHTDGTLTLRRYQAPHANDSRRKQVPFVLTHEALGRLVREITR